MTTSERDFHLCMFFGKDEIKGKMQPESVDTGIKVLGQPRLLCSEMQQTTVGGFIHGDGIFK